MKSVLATYVAAHFPNWVLTAFAIALLHHWTFLPGWLGVALVAVWVMKDLLLFRRRRWLYCSDPPERRIIGQLGTAVTPIAPEGYVRVQGELWHASSQHPLTPGTRVRVHGVDGLRLHVSREH